MQSEAGNTAKMDLNGHFGHKIVLMSQQRAKTKRLAVDFLSVLPNASHLLVMTNSSYSMPVTPPFLSV